MTKTRKIGFRIDEEVHHLGLAIIPVDLESGEDIEGLVSSFLSCNNKNTSQLTFTIELFDIDKTKRHVQKKE